MTLNLAVYVVEVWSEGAWTPVNPLGVYGGRLNAFPLRYMAERARRVLRLNGHKARVTPAVLS